MARIPTPLEKTFIIRAVLEGIKEGSEELLDRVEQLGDELADALPFSPIDAIDAIIRFATGLGGFIVALPFDGLKRIMRKEVLPLTGTQHTVVTASTAVEMPFRAFESFMQQITLTSENSLITFLAGLFARMLWRLGRRFSFLLRLLNIRNELQLIDFVVNAMVKKVYKVAVFARIVGAILGILTVLAWAGAQLSYLGLIFMMLEGQWQDLILPQDSQRVGGTRKGQHRLNLRKGSDK